MLCYNTTQPLYLLSVHVRSALHSIIKVKKSALNKARGETDLIVPIRLVVFRGSARMNGYFCSTHHYSRFDTSPFMKGASRVTNALPVRRPSSRVLYRHLQF